MKKDKLKKFHLCDRKACDYCPGLTYEDCRHTEKLEHAKYKTGDREFERVGEALFELER